MTKTVHLNILSDHLFDLPNEEVPPADLSHLSTSRAGIFTVQILSMLERLDPPPDLEESKHPELTGLNLAEESRISPFVDSMACGLLDISVVEYLQFKRQ